MTEINATDLKILIGMTEINMLLFLGKYQEHVIPIIPISAVDFFEIGA